MAIRVTGDALFQLPTAPPTICSRRPREIWRSLAEGWTSPSAIGFDGPNVDTSVDTGSGVRPSRNAV